jgi:hypothetical protein
MVQPSEIPVHKKPSSAAVWVGLILLIVGIAAGIGFSVYGGAVIINVIQGGVPAGTTRSVTIDATGCRDLYFFAETGTLPSADPKVEIRDPSGNTVNVSSRTCDDAGSTGSSTNFRIIGSFDAPTTGAYSVEVGTASGGSNTTVKPGPPLSEIGQQALLWFGLAFGLGGLLSIVGLTVLIVGLVRRGKARKRLAGPPPGAWGGPGGPGGYGQAGYGQAPPGYGQPGGPGAPPPAPATPPPDPWNRPG